MALGIFASRWRLTSKWASGWTIFPLETLRTTCCYSFPDCTANSRRSCECICEVVVVCCGRRAQNTLEIKTMIPIEPPPGRCLRSHHGFPGARFHACVPLSLPAEKAANFRNHMRACLFRRKTGAVAYTKAAHALIESLVHLPAIGGAASSVIDESEAAPTPSSPDSLLKFSAEGSGVGGSEVRSE